MAKEALDFHRLIVLLDQGLLSNLITFGLQVKNGHRFVLFDVFLETPFLDPIFVHPRSILKSDIA